MTMSDTFFYIVAISIYGLVVILHIIQIFDHAKLEKRVDELEKVIRTEMEKRYGGHQK